MIDKRTGTFISDGLELAYTVSGEGAPILLITVSPRPRR